MISLQDWFSLTHTFYFDEVENGVTKVKTKSIKKTRMATFIKAKLKISVEYRVAANTTEYHIISKLIFQN